MVTLESPSKAISIGHKDCFRRHCKKMPGGVSFEIIENKRTDIIFHPGNTFKDSSGCVLLGSKFGAIAGIPGILESRKACEQFLKYTEDENGFTLKVE